MDDVKEVDADTRQGLRILADSTKLKGTEGAVSYTHLTLPTSG